MVKQHNGRGAAGKAALAGALMVLTVVVAACAPAAQPPVASPTNPPAAPTAPATAPAMAPQPAEATPPAPAGKLVAAVGAAQVALADKLGLKPSEVQVVSSTQAEWDGCLGLPKPDEVCTMIAQQGWKVILHANGHDYEAHTNATGDQVRIAGM